MNLVLLHSKGGSAARNKAGIDVNMLSRFEKAEGGSGGGEGTREKGEGSEQVSISVSLINAVYDVPLSPSYCTG